MVSEVYSIPDTPPLQAGLLTARRAPMPALTGLRFFAALYVVIYHSRFAPTLADRGFPMAAHFFENGNFAVLLFFLLSGFILAYTYLGQIETSSQQRKFWEARYSRIWPLYALSLLASTLVEHSTPAKPLALATLLMVQAWNPLNLSMAGAWNYVCWTLSAEAFFYLLFPFVQRTIERLTVKQMAVLVAIVLAVTVLVKTGQRGYGSPTSGVYRYLPLAIVRTPDFLAGVCLGNLYLRRSEAAKTLLGGLRWQVPAGAFTIVGALCSIFLLCHAEGWWTAFLGVGFSTLLLGLIAERSLLRRFLSSPALQLGGKISYGMYLLQWPCKMVVNRVCDRTNVTSSGGRFAIDLAVLLVISTVTFYSVEEPSRLYMRALFSRLELASAPKLL